MDNRETQIELFEPPYYTRPDRPRITSAPSFASYKSTFTIRTPDAAVISRVALIRAGSATHAFNGDQRYVGLSFTRGTDELYATAPRDGNIAPPGQYLLFIVSLIGGEAVPSVGTFVRVDWRSKVSKELKAELKEFFEVPKELKAELKELEVPVKRMPDIPDLKLTREVFDPNLPFIIDPNPLIRLLAERVDDLEDRLAQGRAFIRPEERPEVGDELLAEDAEAPLAAREAEEGEPYRPSPAEEQERRIGTEGEHAPELGSPEHEGHGHADVPPGPGGLPEAGDEEADQQIPE